MTTLTGRAWALARAELAKLAHQIREACEHEGQLAGFVRLQDTIREREKAHRRFAPAGVPRPRLPVSSAVDFFVVRTFAHALAAGPSEPVGMLAGMRDDYIRARVLCAYEPLRSRIERTIGASVRAVAEKYDYAELV